MIRLMHFGYKLNMQEAIKKLEKLKRLKIIKMNGKSQENAIIGLQEHALDLYNKIILYYAL